MILKKLLMLIKYKIGNFFKLKEIVYGDSYYPLKKRKKTLKRWLDNIVWIIKNNEANEYYNFYGLDIVGSNIKEYIPYEEFRKSRNKINRPYDPYSLVVLLRDKKLFYETMNMHKFPVAKIIGIIINGIVYDINMNRIENIKKEIEGFPLFIKDNNGECASFIEKINSYDEMQTLLCDLTRGVYIIQEAIKQISIFNNLNPYSVNSLRIVTTMDKYGETDVFSSIFRIGTTVSKNADNWSKGGIAIGVKNNGELNEFGFCKPQYGGRLNLHPDSGVIFKNFKIPYYKETIKLVCNAHKLYYGIGAIGWDVAITEEGPMIIEGNDNWEISVMQGCNGPLKKEWQDVILNS